MPVRLLFTENFGNPGERDEGSSRADHKVWWRVENTCLRRVWNSRKSEFDWNLLFAGRPFKNVGTYECFLRVSVRYVLNRARACLQVNM